jgi:hypothetical protein
MNNRIERLESIKAGICGAMAAGIGYSLVTMGMGWLAIGGLFPDLPTLNLDLNALVQLGIAATGGFLFGMTYRYIIRTDRNHHLKSGAVLAFGLVRGLAQVKVTGLEWAEIMLNGLIVVDSLLVFAIARYSLDYALSVRWILPFK